MSQAALNPQLAETLRRAVMVPVLTVDDDASAVAMARALVEGGLDMLEITLRTPAAVSAIAAIVRALPAAIIGAGTVRTGDQARAAIQAGARFLVSPGATPRLLDEAEQWHVPFLPGAITPSEAMALAERGYRTLKFFPAEPLGGAATLKALAAPIPDISFCPTGGISPANAAGYLSIETVPCVGGAWVAPADAVARQDWTKIRDLAAEARALRR